MRDFCDCDWLQREKMGASPMDRDPGLAALNIQLPGIVWVCLLERGRKGPDTWAMGV